jgi:hypothetical protein
MRTITFTSAGALTHELKRLAADCAADLNEGTEVGR